MSKPFKPIFRAALIFGVILQLFYISQAQSFQIIIKITGSNAFVTGDFAGGNEQKTITNFSILQSYAGQENLAARFSGIELFNKNGRMIEYKKFNDGEFLATENYFSWKYQIVLKPLNPTAMAHISWLSDEQGILMTGDLLPQFGEKSAGKFTFDLPADWQILSSEKKVGENIFEVTDVDKAVFFIGKNVRNLPLKNKNARFSVKGDFLFDDVEAAQMADEILDDYQKLFGGIPNNQKQILLVRYPNELQFGRWEAETRGSTVTILSADMPFNTQSAQKLHEQLRHEIFHLWIPNGVNLSGNYDWFYEGFALYQSLRTGLAVNRLRFEDFLDTLSRAYDIDNFQTQKVSLIEASKNRWNGANTQVYARGMVVAFLIDGALMQKSKGKTTLSDILREVFQKHNSSMGRQDGNEAILKILESHRELIPLVEKYIKGVENIGWQTDLDAIGIESKLGEFPTKLTVKAKLSGRQKDLLDKLGYNNWRNFSRKSK